ASGRYRVWTKTAERCGNMELTVSRLVSAGGSGEVRMRLADGGRAAGWGTSPLGLVTGRNVYVSPDTPSQAPWLMRYADYFPRPRQVQVPPTAASACGGGRPLGRG